MKATWMLAFALLAAGAAEATERKAEYAGVAEIIDGDTLRIGGDTIRLADIDAPESPSQWCERADGTKYRCGEMVAAELRAMTKGRRLSCRFVEWNPARFKGQTDRAVARCFLNGADIGATLVAQGLAVPYSSRSPYQQLALGACISKVGLWQGSFEHPRTHRSRRSGGEPQAPRWLGRASGKPCLLALR